jgi:PAS domain S-box-containing protein
LETESGLDSESYSEKKNKIRNAVTALKRKNAQLKRKLQSLELVFRNAVDILVVVDAPTGRIRRVSDAAEAVLGYERSNLIGKKLVEILPSEEKNDLLRLGENIPEIVDGVFLDQKLKCNDGSFKSMDMTTSLVDSNGFSVILLTFRDTSERKLHLREMIKKNSALDSALSAMIMTDSSWKIDYANLEALNYWRYSRTNMLHLELSDLFSFIDDFDNMKSCIEEKGQWDDGIECLRRDSTSFVAHATAVEVVNNDEIDSSYILSFLDITKRVNMEKKLTELSLRDNLTGLYNRRGFMTIGRQLLDSSRRKQPEIGLLYVDIDYLKLINDKLGHATGDKAIEITAEILRDCFRDSDIIARLGGDEFVVLFLDTTEFTVNSIRERIDVKPCCVIRLRSDVYSAMPTRLCTKTNKSEEVTSAQKTSCTISDRSNFSRRT